MTVSTTISRNDYTGGGGVTVFPYSFRIFQDSDLQVFVNSVQKVSGVDYTVSGIGNVTGGNVTFTVAPDGFPVALIRNVPATQLVQYVPNDSFPAETHEGALDKITAVAQQIIEKVGRALTLHPTSTLTGIQMDDLIAGKFLVVDSTGTKVTMGDVGTLGAIAIPVSAANGGTGQTSLGAARDALLASSDSRTATVAIGETIKVTTSGVPAAGIGVGSKYQAQSSAETPSDFGQIQFAASNVGSGTVATYCELLLRVAGAALTSVFQFVSSTLHRAIFKHANTADRIYLFPDVAGAVPVGLLNDATALTVNANSTAAQNLKSYVIAAGSLNYLGATIRFTTHGLFTAVGAETITPVFNIAGTFASSSINTSGAIAGDGWDLDVELTTTAVGPKIGRAHV